MTPANREALDAAVLAAIEGGSTKNFRIVQDVARRLEGAPNGDLYRLVDRSLQRLRGKGRIRFKGGDWSVVDPATLAGVTLTLPPNVVLTTAPCAADAPVTGDCGGMVLRIANRKLLGDMDVTPSPGYRFVCLRCGDSRTEPWPEGAGI